MNTLPSIMILGTYHMANPDNGDAFNAEADSILSEQRQKEIKEVIELIKQFRP